MWFVRSLSDALKFRPWLRFWSLACISSGCGRSVALWGFCCVVCGLWSVPVSVSAVPVLIRGPLAPCPVVGCFARFLRSICWRFLCRSVAAFQVCRLWSDALRPCLAPYFVRYGLLFCFAGSSSPVALFSFCGLFTASDFWQRFRFWAWLWCGLSAAFRLAFGRGLPVVFWV